MGSIRTIDDIAVATSGAVEMNDGKIQHTANVAILWAKDNMIDFEKKMFDIGNRDNQVGVGLAADDFLHEGAELEEPSHILASGRWTATAVIQAVPYHIDTIPVPFGNYNQS